MPQPTVRSVVTLVALALVSSAVALSQSTAPTVAPALPSNTPPVAPSADSSKDKLFIVTVDEPNHSWGGAQSAFTSKHKLVIVTFDQPQRRQTCRVKSFTVDKLVCTRAFGGPRTYLPQQVLALIIPGDENLNVPLWLGFNGGSAASIWGTVVLVATCPACAAATAFAAFFFLAAAGVTLIGGNQPDRLLYLAPGQQLTGKLRSIRP